MPRHFLRLLLLTSSFVPPAEVMAQGFSPQEALRRMRVPEGFEVRLVACEPDIRQPLSITFDARGRMWVIQYLQYPNPAGLKPVKVDQFLRTVYDRLPEPPPKGPRGADRITILDDPDANGRFRKSKDFVAGLNLATGLALGHGGVYVVQPPYLLFYADKNEDDVPDGDPEVLLTGFGMEDSHAYANSLQWGPDGWLYGAQGSTVTARIRGIEFQQGIWRYHPRTREFELFSEGGGNTWGLDFDRHGNAIAGTNWGGKAMLHQVQGGYYVKGFAKHGPLHNPYTFGYFDHVPYERFKGGHVTCGGIIYQGGAYPTQYHHQYIAGNLLSNNVYWHKIERHGSSFTAAHGGDFLIAHDTWFRPVDCLSGPDGSVYVADWYDRRANHVDPVDNWDRTNGRIYKISARGTPRQNAFDLQRKSTKELVEFLSHPNTWYVREARRLLAERREESVIPELRRLVRDEPNQLALEALWALYVSDGFTEELAQTLLQHPNEYVRAWTIRLAGDRMQISSALRDQWMQVAARDSSAVVRSQLACSCKRLPGTDALPMIAALLHRHEDISDPHIPLLLWWALESKAISDRERVLAMFGQPDFWRLPLVSKYIVERIGRRYMAAGGDQGADMCSRLIALAPGPHDLQTLIGGMEKALEGRQLAQVPPALEKQLRELWGRAATDLGIVRFALRLGSQPAYAHALQLVADGKIPDARRAELVDILGQIGRSDCVPILLRVLAETRNDALRGAILAALQPFAEPAITTTVLSLYPKLTPASRNKAQSLLCSRPASALEFLQAVEAGRISPKDVSLEQLQQILRHGQEPLARLIEKHWGKVGALTTGEKQARIRSVEHMLNLGKGDLRNGKVIFEKNCATCHALFGEGNKIGPDLTTADRKSRHFLVASVVDPSAVVRPEFVAYTVETTDGRVLNGLIVDATSSAVTLVDAKNERIMVPRARIESDGLKASAFSLMPEKILDPLDDQQICDLFSYLQCDTPASAPLKVCLVSGSLEYKSDESLAAFQKFLEQNFHVQCSRAFRKTDEDLPGLENLATCDVMLLFTRRLKISGDQLKRVQDYCLAGKPIVGVRTASHAFQNWLVLDKDILGGNYQGHFGAGPLCDVRIADRAQNHAILKGVRPFRSEGSLYKNTGLAKDVRLLLTGSIPDHSEPVAWTREYKGGRIFYTSLGHPKDFEDDNFKQLLTNALFWTAKREVTKKPTKK